jgi:hypothetical protein
VTLACSSMTCVAGPLGGCVVVVCAGGVVVVCVVAGVVCTGGVVVVRGGVRAGAVRAGFGARMVVVGTLGTAACVIVGTEACPPASCPPPQPLAASMQPSSTKH